jgi:ABC-type glycerol-3-phosphate transport system substrate-binding protein
MLCTSASITRRVGGVTWRSLLVVAAAACSAPPSSPAPIHFLHTFGPGETELVNKVIADRGLAVEPSLVPFARGQQVIREILRAGSACPDLIRIDATWLPGFVDDHLLAAPPASLAGLDWTPDAAQLASYAGAVWGAPQTVDGLVVVRDVGTPAPASPAIADLVRAAADVHQLAHPLGVRVDAYWLVPWLRTEGAELAPDHIGGGAVRGLADFAALFGRLAAAPPPQGSEAPDELRRWSTHELAYWVTGPWQLGSLAGRDAIAVSPLAHAPRGGQLLVVPSCAADPDRGWRLASELTSIDVELIFSDAFATVPTRRAALDHATPLARAIADALSNAEVLPRSPITPLLFDDLNPALAAVVAGDATADEAMGGVARGWARLAGAHE